MPCAAHKTQAPSLAKAAKNVDSGIIGDLVELFFDAQKLVIFGDSIRARQASGLDLTGTGGDRKAGDEGIFGLAGAMADYAGIAGARRQIDGIERLGDRADLVDLDENGVGDALVNAAPKALGIGDKEVVAHKLNRVAKHLGQRAPALPVILIQAVFDADNRVLLDQLNIEGDELRGAKFATFA